MYEKAPFTLGQLSELLETKLQGKQNLCIHRLASLQNASADSLSFLTHASYKKYLDTTKAAAVILSPEFAKNYHGNALIHQKPYLIFARASSLFKKKTTYIPSIDPSCNLATDVEIDKSVWIGSNTVIDKGAKIAENVYIGAGAYIGKDVQINAHTTIKSNVTICDDTKIGKNCIIHEGAVIGSDGFGFAHDGKKWIRIAQLGKVIINNDVEVGANTTIDRGALEDTIIYDNVILDNQIQIAHNVQIGSHSALAANVKIAGSTKIGARCMIGGGAAINGHLTIADGVKISGMAVITKSIVEPDTEWSPGFFRSMLLKEWKKNLVRLPRLNYLFTQMNVFEKRLKNLEKKN